MAVTPQMSYEQAAGGAAGGGGGHDNNGMETPGQWGPRAMGATVVCCTMGRRGTAARPTAAADMACRVFKSFPGPVFLQGSQSLGQPDGHLMPAWWAEGPGPAPRSSCGHGNANCGPKTEGKRARARGGRGERDGEGQQDGGERALVGVAQGWPRRMPHGGSPVPRVTKPKAALLSLSPFLGSPETLILKPWSSECGLWASGPHSRKALACGGVGGHGGSGVGSGPVCGHLTPWTRCCHAAHALGAV